MKTFSSSPLPNSATTAPGTAGPVQFQPQLDPDVQEPANGQRALVLGGGGSTGNAWLIGVIAGLFDAGLDVTTAHLTVGTSAGSTAAAQLAGATPGELFEAILAAAPQRPRGADGAGESAAAPSGGRTGTERHAARPVVDHMERTGTIMKAASDMADMRRRLGAAAIEMAASMEGASTRWRATVASRLPQPGWPERTILLTAVNARTGDPVTFDRHSGVELVDAVAASCASGFAYSIGTEQYIDGGYRANAENADLAAGYGRVLVLAPFGGRTRTPLEWGMHLAGQVEALRADGSRVETVFPESDSEHMFGVNAMDLSLRPAAARAGFEQGRALAGQLAEFWGSGLFVG
ncbi:NTE family protein [Paenarthrobacter nitroguajacolicus]|uniref:patatin-like phospholipase family protein n=1 Tax=Paenarthrobacter nitroguajacolicus TaxID=211146 RepID=UPI00286364B3|nr:patatin-like phospholipase family protein [Paenarthrobacter nitroguajacolicus]MDR6989906.1 NTE family protein [Paenarthrobacter nitroguajacolicus]